MSVFFDVWNPLVIIHRFALDRKRSLQSTALQVELHLNSPIVDKHVMMIGSSLDKELLQHRQNIVFFMR